MYTTRIWVLFMILVAVSSWIFSVINLYKKYFIKAPNIELVSLLESPEDTRNDCDAIIADFLIGDLNLQIVNISLKDDANIKFLNDKISDLISEEETVMLCIDFSNCNYLDGKLFFD